MQTIKAVGRDAAAKKYDLLSAMMAHALAGDQNRQRLVLRLMSLITTRYNWQRDELTIGQREIARLWCVDERTVKRDMSRLKGLGWIEVKRQGARGRVSVLGLNLGRIMQDTRPEWGNIGEDFVQRAGGPDQVEESRVIPFPRSAPAMPLDGVWAQACHLLSQEDGTICDAWFAPLAEAGSDEGCLTLIAPSRFHANYIRTHLMERLRLAVQRSDGTLTRVRIETR
ncbi:DnaA N-terminal domain-containing protein [Paracoccus ravus]|uniref:DnaA N-terminal domain-containing protein n=1 Tax=Paracoccus ravus TaxID=2447760 RepID=UPI00106E1655|nr:DnaA N-terminal domain-containing protein [Paracoccus ravus]